MRKPYSGESGSDLITLRTFDNESEANLAKSALQAFGIHCMINRDDCGGLRPPLSMAQGIKLVIRAEDAYRAAAILADET